MSLTIRKPSQILVLLLLLLGVAGAGHAIMFMDATGPDLSAQVSAPGSPPTFVAGPYVQNMSTRGVTIMWQISRPSVCEVFVMEGNANGRYVTEDARCLGEVTIGDLAPDTRYIYRVTVVDSVNSADRRPLRGGGVFNTFPDKERPVKFIVYGDSRSRPERHAKVVSAMMSDRDADFALHTGDIVGSGWPDEWVPEFFAPADGVIGRIPFFTALGNHENNSPLYFRYFSLPGAERWYSFDILNVHIVVLDSNVSFDEDSEQYQWLIADLDRHRRAGWVFVMMHHPVYTSGWHGALGEDGLPREEPIRIGQRLFPRLAKEYGITVFFSGHDHQYEHSMVDGVHYVITGGGGAPGNKDSEVEKKDNKYGGFSCAVLHYCAVTVDGDSALLVAKTIDGEVLDAFEMESRRARSAVRRAP
jgi:predicted phosphodiesterase